MFVQNIPLPPPAEDAFGRDPAVRADRVDRSAGVPTAKATSTLDAIVDVATDFAVRIGDVHARPGRLPPAHLTCCDAELEPGEQWPAVRL